MRFPWKQHSSDSSETSDSPVGNTENPTFELNYPQSCPPRKQCSKERHHFWPTFPLVGKRPETNAPPNMFDTETVQGDLAEPFNVDDSQNQPLLGRPQRVIRRPVWQKDYIL